ncbi:hypothetical protein ACEPAF_6316 [Sanghuangporus sanghuang]
MVAFSLLAALSVSAAAVTAVVAHPHPHPEGSRTRSAPLPDRWYHDEDHPVHALFRSQPTNGKRQSMPEVGSSAWTAQYPASSPDVNDLPQAWLDALNDAKDAGKIPALPPTTYNGVDAPHYPTGIDENRNNATICAATDRVCRIPQDVWDAPDGYMGIGFDDGPTDASPTLYDFLEQQNLSSTHYMIGVYILNNWRNFQMAYDVLEADIAVHTWTHPFMTTLTDEQVLGQLGWTIQIIYDSTDGKVPRFWRPPYGDIDTRVSAIAREVFGMTAVMWNQDTEDWSMASTPPGTTMDQIHTEMTRWLTGPKSPGLIILEHELTNDTVQAFIDAYPMIGQNGWNAISQVQLNSSWTTYQDGEEDDDAFNSFITPSASSSSASESASSGSGSSAASASASDNGLTAESNSSGSTPSFVYPSLVSFGVLVGGILVLM